MALGDIKKFGRGKPKPRDLSHIFVDGIGPKPCDFMLIAERPGKQEAQASVPRPLIGISGAEMDRYLAAGGLNRDNFYITSLVKNHVDRDPEEWEIIRDLPALYRELSDVFPTIIATMGRFSTRHFLGDVDMEVVHGIPVRHVDPEIGPVTIVPVMHPAAGFYNADTQPLILGDFRALGDRIRDKLIDRVPGECTPWRAWYEPNHIQIDDPTYCALDTEGWLHAPWGLSLSAKDGIGIVARKSDSSVWTINHAIERACIDHPEFVIYLHNSLHDLPILDGLGVHIPEDRFRDTMVLAYLLGTEPQGLKPLAYRHCNMEMQSYVEVVGPYYRAVFEEYVRTAAEMDGLPDWEEEYVIIDPATHEAKLKRPWGIARHLRKIIGDAQKAQSANEDFDFVKRWNNIEDYKKTKVVLAIGQPPEQSLDLVPDEEAIPYSGCDAVATRRIAPILERRIRDLDLTRVAEIDHRVIPMFDRMQRTGCKVDVEALDKLADHCSDRMAQLQERIKDLTGCRINPDSGDQVAQLIFDNLGLDRKVTFVIPKTDSDKRLSTNDKILEALRFTDDVVGLVCDYREVSKVRSSFCWSLSRYARRRPDRRIHPNFRLTRVSSGRPSCSEPNLLAIPVRSDLGKLVRACFIADEGHVLYDIDLSQVEMRYMADESKDESLIRDFAADIDVHDSTGSRLSGYPLAEYVADKKTRKKWRDPAKRVNFGVITQITKHGLVAQMRLANATKNGVPLEHGGQPWEEADCDKMLEDYFQYRTGVKRYIDDCHAEVRRFGQVRDRWGRIRLLPGIDSPLRHIREEALRAASSHKIQAGAAGIMKQNQATIWGFMHEWWRRGWYVEPLLQVYDELLLEVEDKPEIREEVDAMCVLGMTQTVQLDHVKLGAEGQFGRNWTEAKG